VRILLVEDERSLAQTVREGLEHEGMVVEVAHDGQQGLAVATTSPFDVVVVDLMLPGLNGYEVCRGMRRDEVWTPVLVLTAKDGEYDQADALDLGADDYLTKPFSFVVLVARLRALARRGGSERPAVLSAGDLSLDPARRRVERAGQQVSLTSREFGLLWFLMRRKGQVVSRDEILENVWDAFYAGDRNVVAVYVNYLRAKIDKPFGREALETVRGAGYRLDEDGG